MHDGVNRPGHPHEICDVLVDQPEAAPVEQVLDVLRPASEEVVEADDVMAVVKETFAKVATEKTGTASDDDSHSYNPRER